MQTRVTVASLALLACASLASAANYNPMITKIEAVDRAQKTGVDATTITGPLRTYSGQSIKFKVTGKAVAEGDEISWVPSSEKNCALAGSGDYTSLALGSVTVSDSARYATTSAAATYTITSANKAAFTGNMKLCYRKKNNHHDQNPTWNAWNFYGTAYKFNVAWVDMLTIEKAWTNQELTSEVNGINLMANDVITWAKNACKTGAKTVTGADDSQPLATVSDASKLATKLSTGGRFKWTTSTYSLKGTDSLWICWNNGAQTNAAETFDTSRRVHVRGLSVSTMFYYIFPSITVDSGTDKKWNAGQKIRIGGWFFQNGDKVQFANDGGAGTAFAGETIIATANIGTAAGFATAQIDVGGKIFGDTAVTTNTAVVIKFLPVDNNAMEVKSLPAKSRSAFFVVHADEKHKAVGKLGQYFKLPFVGAADFSGNAALFLRGVENTAYVYGRTENGDAIKFIPDGADCLSTTFGTDLTFADGTWPQVKYTYNTEYYNTNGAAICYKTATAYEVGTIAVALNGAETSIDISTTGDTTKLPVTVKDVVQVDSVSCAVDTDGTATAIGVTTCTFATQSDVGAKVNLVYKYIPAGAGTAAEEPYYQAVDSTNYVAASAVKTNAVVTATEVTVTDTQGHRFFDGDKVGFEGHPNVYEVTTVTANTITLKTALSAQVDANKKIVRAYSTPATMSGVMWYMNGFTTTRKFTWSGLQATAPALSPTAAEISTSEFLFYRDSVPASTSWEICQTAANFARAVASAGSVTAPSASECESGESAAVPVKGLISSDLIPMGNYDVTETESFGICARAYSTTTYRSTSMPQLTGFTIKHHPAINVFPLKYEDDLTATPNIELTFNNVKASEKWGMTVNAADTGDNVGLCTSATLTAAQDVSSGTATIPRTDVPNDSAPKYCILREGDTSGYHFIHAAVPANAKVAGATTPSTSLWSGFYKGASADYTFASGNTISAATGIFLSSVACATGTAGTVATIPTKGSATDAKFAGLTYTGDLTTTGKWCQGANLLVDNVNVAEVKAACSKTGEYACGTNAVVDVKHYGFSVTTDAASQITFDVSNNNAGDRYGWATGTDGAKASLDSVAITGTPAFTADAVDASHSSFANMNGGVYTLFYKPNGAPAFANTGKTFTFVKFVAQFPPAPLIKGSVTIWYSKANTGFSAGDKVALVKTIGDCAKVNAGVTATPDDKTAPVALADFGNDLKATFDLSAWTADTSVAGICYVTSAMAANTAADFAQFTGGAIDIKLAASGAEIPTSNGGTLRINSGVKTSFTFTDGTLQDSATTLKLVNDAGAVTCDTATAAAAPNAVAAATKTAAGYANFDFAVTATAVTDEAGSTYQICYAGEAGATAFKGVVATKYVATSITSVEPLWLAKNPATGVDQTLTLVTVAGDDADSFCIVKKGATAPTAAACAAGSTNGVADVTTTATKAVFNKASVQSLDVGEYDIYYNAGGNTGFNTPQKHSQTLVVVEPKVTPGTYLETATGDLRTVYTDVDTANADGDKFYFGSSDTCATAKDNKKTTASSTLSDVALAVADTKICYKYRGDARADADDQYVRIAPTITVKNAFEINTSGQIKYHAGVATPVTFSKTSETVQPGDIYRILKNGKVCATDTAEQESDGTVAFVNYAATPTATVTLSASDVEYGVCWAKKSAATTFVDFPTATASKKKAHVVYVKKFSPMTLVASAALFKTADNAAGKNPRVTFTGHNVAVNDVASFVQKDDTDCMKAWYYEQAVDSSNDKQTEQVAADQTATADFVVAAGFYKLCYWATNTLTGYNAYAALNLRVSDAMKVMPPVTTAGKPTTFTLTPKSKVTSAKFTADDRVTFITKGSADCTTANRDRADAAGIHNVTATSDFVHNFTSEAAPTNAGKQYTLCSDLDESIFYNAPASSSDPEFAVSGMLNAMATVTVFSKSKIAAVTPSSVIRNTTATLMVWGGYLAADDKVGFNTTAADAVCGSQDWAVEKVSAELNSVTVSKPYSDNLAGEKQVCYKYGAGAVSPEANPEGASTHGVKVQVVDVTSVTPTGSVPTTSTGGVEITFNGHFNAAENNDWAYLIESDDFLKDCSKFGETEVTEQWIINNRRKLTNDGATKAKAMFNVTSLSMAKEYRACVSFGGTVKTGDVKKDWWLAPKSVVFSVRKVNDFNPPSIVNNTATQMIHFNGAGIRDWDNAAAIAETGAVADCASSTNKSPVKLGKAAFDLSAGKYKICYQFNHTDAASISDDWVLVNSTANAALLVEDYQLKSLQSPSTAMDIRETVTVRVRGTGPAGDDLARLVNATDIAVGGPAACDSSTSGSSWQKVSRSMEKESRDDVWWSVPAGEISGAGSFAVCYKFNGGKILKAYNESAWQVTFTEGPRVEGSYPKSFAATGTAQINVVGYKLTDGDKLALTQVADCAGAFTNKVNLNVTDAGANSDFKIATATVTTVAEGDHHLCYYFGGKDTDFKQIKNAVKVGGCSPTCDSSKRFQCGCECQAEPCAAPTAKPCGDTGFTFCGPSGVCARTASMCPRVETCPADKAYQCPLGNCARTSAECAPISACPKGATRCQDGSCSFGDCVFQNKPIAVTCPADQELCADGVCRATGQCPPYDGCPIGQDMCADCSCVDKAKVESDCPSCKATNPEMPFKCYNGSCVRKQEDCKCFRYEKVPNVVVSLTGANRKRRARRFVVRANVAYDFSLGEVVSISFPAALTTENTCKANIMSVPGSYVRSVQSATAKVIATPFHMNLMSGNATGTATGCPLDEAKEVIVSYKAIEIPTSVAITCSFASLDGATVTATRTADKAICTFKGTSMNGAVVASDGTIIPPSPPATPTPPLPSTTPVPSTNPSSSVAPSGTAAPSGGPTDSSPAASPVSSAGAVTLSKVLAAVLAVLVAALM